MDHQSFRYYIPGIIFLLPIYVMVCWITINYYTDSEIRTFVLVGGITTFPLIALPVGWWIYNAYRVWWLIFTKGGYENKDFIKLIRKDTKPFYSPLTQSILIDFSQIKDIKSWIKFDPDIFRKTFYPFTSKKHFYDEIKQKAIQLKFTESLSDIVLFKDNGYDYARSISSVRYGFESSVFALLLSCVYTLGIKVIWLYQFKQTDNIYVIILWFISIILVSTFIVITLFIRWKMAGKEYDARLLLTTITSLNSSQINPETFQDNIPKHIVEQINKLSIVNKPFAAFDLDNTLLVDDIGEAVFALLVKRGAISNFNWDNYLTLLEKDKLSAYKKVVEVMNGLKTKVLKDTTYELIDHNDKFIEIGNYKIPIPTPNSIMQSLITLLKLKGVEVYVVTASNKISAEIVCWQYFGIPSSNVFGAEVKVDKSNRIQYENNNIPFAEGKVSILKQNINGKPIITGGDGIWDKFLLDYTKSEGIRLWLGRNKKEYQKLKENYYKDLQFLHILEEKKCP